MYISFRGLSLEEIFYRDGATLFRTCRIPRGGARPRRPKRPSDRHGWLSNRTTRRAQRLVLLSVLFARRVAGRIVAGHGVGVSAGLCCRDKGRRRSDRSAAYAGLGTVVPR